MSRKNAELRTCTPAQIKRMVAEFVNLEIPVMVWGPPGVGKSDIMEQIAKEQKRHLVDIRLLLVEPTDLRGIPYFNATEGKMKWAPPEELPFIDNGKIMENALLFLDEINAAPQSVQAASYQLILNRRIGPFHLAPGVGIVAAGNRESDKAVTHKMPSALANRFAHLEIEPHYDSWRDWAIKAGVHADVVGFLEHMPNKLFNFDPKSASRAFATPRSWTTVSKFLKETRMPLDLITTGVSGMIGDGLAAEFISHREYVAKMPTPMEVLSGKVKKLNDRDLQRTSAMYAMTIALCYKMKEVYESLDSSDKVKKKEFDDYSDNFFGFMNENAQPEMQVLAAISLTRHFGVKANTQSKEFKKFYEKNKEHVLGQ